MTYGDLGSLEISDMARVEFVEAAIHGYNLIVTTLRTGGFELCCCLPYFRRICADCL
jgi:hypothetical protein